MRTIFEDCWHPRPGSWEEVVDPYDIQCAYTQPLQAGNETIDAPIETLTEPQPSPSVLTPLTA